MDSARQKAPDVVPDPARSPERAGSRYRVLGKIGGGGMGIVYRALDETTGRTLALKRMGELKEGRRSAELRFRREFHSLATLRHPRIVEAYDYGVDDEGPYYTMEIVDGNDLRDEKELSPRDVVLLLRDVASALAFLHARALVHRDVGPRNVRRTPDGRAKLIDFGVLGSVGLSGDVSGTLTYIAPEVFRGLPIDGRTDLYSLGVLGYVLLTGRPPYDVKGRSDVELAFREVAIPPSISRPDIPKGLDELLLGLVSTEPMGRPASAAETIDRLSAMSDLPSLDEAEVTRGYLTSTALVGRKREMRSIRRRVLRATKSRGGGVVIRAESGTGKSRVLREAELEAKLAGCLVVRAHCESATGTPYGVMEQVARALFENAPDLARAASRPHAEALSVAFRDLRARFGPASARPFSVDPGEERMRIQRAVLAFLFAIDEQKPLVILVDDLQRCDEASCAVFAALLRGSAKRGVLFVAALRAGETARAPAALATICEASKVLDMGGLDDRELKDLLVASFGDVPNIDRLAHVFAKTNGSPMFASELTRDLVERGVVKHVDGVWVIPDELLDLPLPSTLAAAVEQRLANLAPGDLHLGEVLALHGGELSLDTIVTLAPCAGLSRETFDPVFAALDRLSAAGVVVGDSGTFRFRHDGFREGLLRRLEAPRAKELHRSIGEALLAAGSVGDARIGLHLLEGGDDARGGKYLLRAGEALYEAQALADCISPLEAALLARERAFGDASTAATENLAIMNKLLAAGWVADRAVGTRYALRVVRGYRRACGFELADRLSPKIGGILSLAIGFFVAVMRWLTSGLRGPNPIVALTSFCVSLGYACGLANAESRVDDLLLLIAYIEPLRVFPTGMPRGIYLGMRAFPDIILGQIRRGSRRFSEAIPLIANDHLAPAKPEEKLFAEVGVRGLRLLLDVNQFERRIDEDLAFIDASPFRYYHLVADATRVVRLRYRGEEDRARRLERKMETASLQLGSWSTDVQVLFFAHPAYALTHDVVGLRRCLEKLEKLVAEGFRIEMRVAITRGDYLRERGEVDEAVTVLRTALATLRPDDLLMRQWGGSALVEALLAQGAHAECIGLARELIVLGNDTDSGVVLPRLRNVRCLGLALAATGHIIDAVKLLEEAIDEAERLDCAPLAGGLHEARARIALEQNDREGYSEHGAAVIRWLRPTKNPALIAMCERLVDAGSRSALQAGPLTNEWAETAVEGSSDRRSGTSNAPSGASGSTSTSIEPPPMKTIVDRDRTQAMNDQTAAMDHTLPLKRP